MSSKAKEKKRKVSYDKKPKKSREISVKPEESSYDGIAGRALQPRHIVVVCRESDPVEDSRNERNA